MREIRYYRPLEIPDVYYKYMFGIKSISKEMRSDKIYREDCDIWCLCVEENRLLSFLGVKEKNDAIWIEHIYVYPEYRHRGLYREMLKSTLCKYPNSVAMASCVEASRKEFYNQGFVRITEGKYSRGYYMIRKKY